MKTLKICLVTAAAGALALAGCEKESPSSAAAPAAGHGHSHGANDTHDHEGDKHAMGDEADHHDEVSLGTAQVGDLEVQFSQGHGELAPGKELHLVVKLPYTDRGATVVRAWLGTEDRFSSVVAKADYAASHDDYDVHAMAPDPLPENTMWWVEIEKPDGTKLLGNIKPL